MADHHDEDLVAELRALGSWLEVAEPADQRAAVRTRLARPRPGRWRLRRWWSRRWWSRRWWPRRWWPRRWWPRRWFIAALAAVVGILAVVPPARAAVIDTVGDLLRVAGIEVRREPATSGLPAQPSPLPSTRSATLEDARRVALFPVRAPAALGSPDQVLLADPGKAGAPRVVTLTFRGGTVRLDQFDGAATPAFFKSAVDASWVDIGTDLAIWLPGPHAVTYVDRDGVEHTETARLAGPTLIWVTGAVTYRLEGLPTLEEARAVALSLR